MSEAAQQLNQQTITDSPASTEAHTGSLYGAGLRIGNEDPVEDWAKGKTARELYEIAEQLRQAINTTNYQQAPQQAPVSHQQLSGQQVNGPPPASLLYDNEAEYNRQMTAYQQTLIDQRLSQYAAPLLASNAENAKYLSQNDVKWAPVWKRWGPEIEAQMASIPPQQRTKQMWDTAAQFVKSNHIDVLAREEAERLMTQGGFGTERGQSAGGAPMASQGSPLDELFADTTHPWTMRAKEVGLTKEDVRKDIERRGLTAEQYVKHIRGEQTFSAGAN